MHIAVIGTGIAGNAAAWSLSKRYPVTVYDREIRPGGHSHTVTIDYEGAPLAVDIGFIVYNALNYPDLTALFAHLGVETVESCMSFAVTADGGRFEWKGGGSNWRQTGAGLFAQPLNLLSPSYLWMLRDILTFNTRSVEDYAAIHWEAPRLWLKGVRLVPRQNAAIDSSLATGKSSAYTSPVLSARGRR
jgi:predicted NAD/FAD-binding protein